jgi:hypothetical protein
VLAEVALVEACLLLAELLFARALQGSACLVASHDLDSLQSLLYS